VASVVGAVATGAVVAAVVGAVTAVVVPYGVHTSVAVPPAYW
jgi:hypothetical protein